MNNLSKVVSKAAWLSIVSVVVAFTGSAVSAPLALPDVPLYLPASVPPLNMLVLGRDHKLYYEAYNDYSDLNDDDVLDFKYKPAEIDYYGYFDSLKCYSYSNGKKRYEPTTATGTLKTCSGASDWSGDFLNYLTTSRIDALRKVLYGGYRSTDTSSETVLERSYIPQDAHSWGKEYAGLTDGYDISKYSSLSLPNTNTRHLFANTTPLSTTDPLLRILENRTERIWNWVSIERPVAGTQVVNSSGSRVNVTPTDRIVRVQVCVSGKEESNCQTYSNGKSKPIGLLQEFGENDSMYFGLLSGSYLKNMSGGVLRREISSMKDEIDSTTGVFSTSMASANKGIITTLNRLKTTGFGGNYEYTCGWNSAARTMTSGECQMWGNPVGEMMYETLRYFAGKGSPTSTFSVAYGAGEESSLTGGGLPVVTSWGNPYGSSRPVCAKPFQTVISDINPSYDTDEVPGTAFGSATGDLPGLDAAALGQTMWDHEYGAPQNIFIGDVNGVTDGAPTAKVVSSFGNIRGLSPEEPTRQGGYYSSSVAYYGRKTDINSVSSDQNVSTFAVALASPLPKISIPVDGKTITLVPFAKSVAGSGISATSTFQPTDQIVDFYVDTLTATSGRFRVNFEDVEQGADHDMDAIAIYEYTVVGSTVQVKVTSEYAAGGITQHMGYVISGTTKDGIYLEVRDQTTGESGSDVDYKLDTPAAFTGTPPAPSSGTGTWKDGAALPFVATRTFSAGTTSGASILKDPLWYAAKWGGYDESFRNEDDPLLNDIPDAAAEWDENNDGDPDNYFLVTNALKLSTQLRAAFEDILRKTTASSSASVNSGSISSETRIYQAKFNTGEWTGQLYSYELDPDTGDALTSTPDWEAGELLPQADSRQIITANTDGTPVKFRWDDLDTSRRALLNATDATSKLLVDYLRGDGANEGTDDGQFRERRTDDGPHKLGDIVNSSPLFVGKPSYRYRDSLESVAYSTFAAAHDTDAERRDMVYAGANDGMLHGFDADTGVEVFGFIPSAVFSNLKDLATQSYSHKFYVDGPPSMGDVFYDGAWHTVLAGGLNKGGQEIYALDITEPGNTLSSAEADASDILLWEFTDEDDKDLGLTYSQPSIVKLQNGKWAAVFGNGYNNTTSDAHTSLTGNAVLYIVDIQTGALIRKLDTGTGIAQRPTEVTWDNGLSTPALVDLNGDRIVEYAYAGDLYGNMWKFDLSSTSSADWDVAFHEGTQPLPLFKARDSDTSGNAQPITVRPEVARGPGGAGMIVLFGTGKYLESSDKELTPERPQSFYGIVDKNTGTNDDRVLQRGKLTQQKIIAEQSYDPDGDGPEDSTDIRVTTDYALGSNSGWYLDLVSPVQPYQAEKQVSNPIVRNDNVIFTTLIPSGDPCAYGGTSWTMELELLDGSRTDTSAFDNNNDGQFTDADLVTVTITNEDGSTETITVAASGLGSDEGILQSPGVVESESSSGTCVQYKYLPGTSGNIERITENCGPGGTGRQSWRQVR